MQWIASTVHARQPNVLFIAVDDLRPALGCYGDTVALSPNIDRLAARGVLFERAYVQQAVCGPTRASLLSGLRPDASGVTVNATRLRERHPDLPILPGHFKTHGYHTLALGKIHHWDEDGAGSWSEPIWRPFDMGPSTREYLLPENLALVRQLQKAGARKGKKAPELGTIKGPAFESIDLINDAYPDGLTADAAVQAMKRLQNTQQPFFLGVGFIKPHLPFACPQKYWDLYDPAKLTLTTNDKPPKAMPEVAFFDSEEMRQYHGTPRPSEPFPEELARTYLHGYLACVSYVDAQVGRLLDTLDALGLSENTVIVLWGDHGWHLGDHGIWGKSTNFEIATRAPLIFVAPGVAAAGGKARGLVEFVDVYPTLAELCDLPLPSHLQGSSLVPQLRDPAAPGKSAAFSQFTRPGNVTGYSIRTEHSRYTEWLKPDGERMSEELYDHDSDPAETRNVAAESIHASMIAKLRRQLQSQRELSAIKPKATAAARPKPPFRVLYSNDTTNILSCISPFHQAREPFRKEMLEATVDEVDGLVDAHLLQPGLGVVPMWPSKVINLEEHYAWIKQRYGIGPDSYGNFTLNGGDIVQTFIDRCRLRHQAAFVSVRMNDAHHKEYVDPKPGDKPGSSIGMSVTRWYADHPQHRIKPDSDRGVDRVLNWAVPAVRTQKFALIQELCENYDLDGLELDFLRTYSYFRLEETPLDQRRAIMTSFVKDVRALLDRTSRDGKRRWLCARVPCYLEALDVLGLDLPALTAVGLDMVNASAHYFTTQQHHLDPIRRRVPDAALYFELCHTLFKGDKVQTGYDVFPYRRATREHLHTSAHLAYAKGADGISLFNFAYYREHGKGEGRGSFGEPPFDALKELTDPKTLARQPQHWFIAPGWRAPGMKPLPVPRKIEPSKPAAFTFHLAAPQGGWKSDVRLRVQFDPAPGAGEWRASFNGESIASTADVSEPFPVAYPSMLGQPHQLRAWTVPAALLREGANKLELTFQGSGNPNVIFLDLAPT